MGVMTEDWLECIMADAAYRDQKFMKVQMVRLPYSCVMFFPSENEASQIRNFSETWRGYGASREERRGYTSGRPDGPFPLDWSLHEIDEERNDSGARAS